MQKLYFVRHGESELNAAGITAGHTETPLTDVGRAQAAVAGKLARDLGIDLIVASPMGRTRETAQLIANELEYAAEQILFHELLKERFFGAREGAPHEPDIHKVIMPPDAENDEQLIARARRAADWLRSLDADTVLVVSHGSFGRALRLAFQPDSDFFSRFSNAEIAQLV